MIEIKDVVRRYGDYNVLNHINISFYLNRIYVIKGNSGCGKSTLLNVIGGLDQDFNGEINVNHVSIKDLKAKQLQTYRQQIGYVFQESLLICDLTIYENFRILCDDENYIQSLAKQFHIEQLLDKSPAMLSNGQRQRVSIIRALLHKPKILLLDEPSASIDQKNAYELAEFIKTMKSPELIIIIVTHDHCFDKIADEELMMHYGEITAIKRMTLENKEYVWKSSNIVKVKNYNEYDKILSNRRFKKSKKNIVFTIACSFLIFMMLSSTSLIANFQKGYKSYLYENYPVWTFYSSIEFMEKRKVNFDEVEIHNLYQKSGNDFTAYSFLPEEGSSLSIPEALLYGFFPQEDNEVIITFDYAKSLAPDAVEESIGKTVNLFGESFQVSAILTNDESVYQNAISANENYLNLPKKSVFISENKMKELNAGFDKERVMFVYVGNDKSDRKMQEFVEKSFSSYFFLQLSEMFYTLDFAFVIVISVLAVIALLIFVFMFFVIHLDLENSKKEIGYLQLLGITKRRVMNLTMNKYILKVFPSWLYALVLYCILFVFINIAVLPIGYGILEILFCSIILYAYMILLVSVPLHKYMKISIKSLIE